MTTIGTMTPEEIVNVATEIPWGDNCELQNGYVVKYGIGNDKDVLSSASYPAIQYLDKKTDSVVLILFIEYGQPRISYSNITSCHPYMDQIYYFDSWAWEFLSMGVHFKDADLNWVMQESFMYPLGYTLKLQHVDWRQAMSYHQPIIHLFKDTEILISNT